MFPTPVLDALGEGSRDVARWVGSRACASARAFIRRQLGVSSRKQHASAAQRKQMNPSAISGALSPTISPSTPPRNFKTNHRNHCNFEVDLKFHFLFTDGVAEALRQRGHEVQPRIPELPGDLINIKI